MTGRQRIGYAPGVFDLFHVGHLNILREASRLCDRLVAGVLTDEMAERGKGVRPVVPFEERLEIVRGIRYVHDAVGEAVPTKLEQWELVGFDVIIKGDDWKGTPKGDRLEADFAKVGVEVAYLPYTQQTSSTLLRRVLNEAVATPTVLAGGTAGPR